MARPLIHLLAEDLPNSSRLAYQGAPVSVHALLATSVALHRPNEPVVLVTEPGKGQEAAFQDVSTWLSLAPHLSQSFGFPPLRDRAYPEVLFFPSDTEESTSKESAFVGVNEALGERQEVALRLAERVEGPRPIVVANASSLWQGLPRPESLAQLAPEIRVGARLDPIQLVEDLESRGYAPEAQVTGKGEVAMRGGIVDVFPLNALWPVRLEFFGDEVESIRDFDPLTQRSREPLECARIPPANASDRDRVGRLLDYLPPQTRFILSAAESDSVGAHGKETWVLETQEKLPSQSPCWRLYADSQSGIEDIEDWGVAPMDCFWTEGSRSLDGPVVEQRRRKYFSLLDEWKREGIETWVLCNNEGERDRYLELWDQTHAKEGRLGKKNRPKVALGTLSGGFLDRDARLAVVSDAEIFGRYRTAQPRRKSRRGSAFSQRSALAMDFTEFEAGDLVVHLEYGVGRFAGLALTEDASGKSRECLTIEYAPTGDAVGSPKLHVPVTEAHLVAKYVGAGKADPPLNTLTGKRWGKAKREATQSVQDLAAEYLRIQALRETREGHAFSSDTAWQREFEAAFLYEETQDQLRAVEEIKKDMESARPMDRLLCGDVGFGKTEVAVRAAFKAALSGKQVAVLAPTTVLCQQHYQTFAERMADYPVRIEMLSRFRTKTAQGRILKALGAGEVDIVIGTHRLTQKDVRFKDLGLVIVDEEQRFGVEQKESFKRMRELVDVLSMSATPIPRTLYLAMTGARDMSVIETPPQERLPVETVVVPFDETIIRNAVVREIERSGQVFFLHNRVETIDTLHRKLAKLIPEARILVGHGQMAGDELERIMTQFVEGKADVLLSTTIIESGIDIPNANTIIIDRADRFGLSQLYQLRGRVGRHNRQSYAYLLLPPHQRLVTDVRKRMNAIKQNSSLGSGFRIAMRDLEIRGAGNLLGAQQSGHIAAVGFDLYCKMLKHSVDKMKGKSTPVVTETTMRLDFISSDPQDADLNRKGDRPAAALPSGYVPDPTIRVGLYRRLAECLTPEDTRALRAELKDRFGPLPDAVELLLRVTELKNIAGARGIQEVEIRGDKILLKRQGDYITLGGQFPRLTKRGAKARLGELRRLLLSF